MRVPVPDLSRAQVFSLGPDKPCLTHQRPETHKEKVKNKGQGSSHLPQKQKGPTGTPTKPI